MQSVTNIVSQLGIYMTKQQLSLFKTAIDFLKIDINTVKLKSSSGTSIVIIPKNMNMVYQFYLFNKTFYKVIENCNSILDLDGFVTMYGHYSHVQTVIFERIEPILEIINTIDVNTLRQHVIRVIINMTNRGITHNDLTLDNIGYSSIRKQFLIYDFETINSNNTNVDLYKFNKSLKFHNLITN